MKTKHFIMLVVLIFALSCFCGCISKDSIGPTSGRMTPMEARPADTDVEAESAVSESTRIIFSSEIVLSAGYLIKK